MSAFARFRRLSDAGPRCRSLRLDRPASETLVWGDNCQADFQSFPSPCSTSLTTISSSRPEFDWPPRAVTVKGGRRPSRSDLPLTVASTAAGYVDRASSPAVGKTTTIPRGARHQARRSRRNLVFGRSVRTGTMMQSCASAAKLRGGGPILHSGLEAMGLAPGHRPLGSSSADRSLGCQGGFSVLPLFCAVAHDAGRKTTPSGTSPVMTRRQRAMSSLRARATIIVLRVFRRPSVVRS